MKQFARRLRPTLSSFLKTHPIRGSNVMDLAGRPLKLILLGVLTIGLIVACNSENPPDISNADQLPLGEDCQVIQHDFGEATVCGAPQRIVALGPNVLDSLLALGGQPAGYAEIAQIQRDDFDDPPQQIPYLGNQITTQPVNLGRSTQPSFDALTKLKPDLIIGGVAGNKDEYNLLSKIAPTLLINNGTSDRWQDSIFILAKALKREDKAQEIIANYEQQIEQTRIRLAPVINAHPKVLVLSGDLKQFIRLSNEISYSGRLLSDLGFQIVYPSKLKDKTSLAKISLEILPQLDADQIIIQGINLNIKDFIIQKLGLQVDNLQEKLTDHQLTNVKQEWEQNAIAQQMKASQEGRVYFTTYYLWHGLRGPIGTQLILDELRQTLL